MTTRKTLLLLLLTSAVVSNGSSAASYLYRKNELRDNKDAPYRQMAPFGFQTVLSPMGVICECLVEVDVPTGKSTVTTSVGYLAIFVNTVYLFIPLTVIYLLVSRKKYFLHKKNR